MSKLLLNKKILCTGVIVFLLSWTARAADEVLPSSVKNVTSDTPPSGKTLALSVAVVHFQKIVENVKEYIEVRKKLEDAAKKLEGAAGEKKREIEAKFAQLSGMQTDLNPKAVETRRGELVRRGDNLNKTIQSIQSEIMAVHQRIISFLEKEVNTILEELQKKYGFSLGITAETAFYRDPNTIRDLTPEVIEIINSRSHNLSQMLPKIDLSAIKNL
jgi:Skp family chaperone for outer membrane proteins